MKGYNWVLLLIFVYFLTLSADLLQMKMWLFKPKVNHIISIMLFLVLFLSGKFRLINKSLFFGFLGVVSSCVISALFSCNVLRSIGYAGVALFTYVMYFLLPLNLIRLYDRQTILRLYLLSFVVIGCHACSQFLLGWFGVFDPFVTQIYWDKLARAQSWTYEPSYYALYITPFVAYLNAKFLLSSEQPSYPKIIGANLLLLVSTSTGGFFSYFIFLFTCLAFCALHHVKMDFPHLRAKLRNFFIGFLLVFCGIGLIFRELFLSTFYKFFDWKFFAHSSFSDRWEKIVIAWETFCESPLFGKGLGGPEQQLYTDTYFNDANVSLHHPTLEMFDTFTMSNVFTEVLASLGLYGMCILVMVIFIIVRKLNRAIQDSLLTQEERTVILSLLISIIVMMICLQFNQGLFRNYIWVHVAICLGYTQRESQKYRGAEA